MISQNAAAAAACVADFTDLVGAENAVDPERRIRRAGHHASGSGVGAAVVGTTVGEGVGDAVGDAVRSAVGCVSYLAYKQCTSRRRAAHAATPVCRSVADSGSPAPPPGTAAGTVYTLVAADQWCSVNSRDGYRTLSTSDGLTIEQCAVLVRRDAACDVRFFGRVGACFCHPPGVACNLQPSSKGNSVYDVWQRKTAICNRHCR